MLIALGCILVFLIAALIYFFGISPGKVAQFLDEKGNVRENSISEKIWVNINDAEQGMFIKGEDVSNPVLLFLHGGPGMPQYFMFDKYETELEKHFIVCYWEQRGAGISYRSDMSGEDITVQQLVSDTAGVANYLRERFGQDKIYLMGHSWGSFIGIQSAAANPELYHAYIGISQISNRAKSEMIAYDYMVERYIENGNTKRINELKKYDIHNDAAALYGFANSALRDTTMHELGIGSMRDMNSVISGIFFPVMKCGAYTPKEKINIWVAKSFLNNHTSLNQEMFDTDLSMTLTEVEVRVYFTAGSFDYTVNYEMQKEYFDRIEAPLKGFYTFENSAHSPPYEEPSRFIEVMIHDIKNGEIALADK